jgi:hypothetical protein
MLNGEIEIFETERENLLDKNNDYECKQVINFGLINYKNNKIFENKYKYEFSAIAVSECFIAELVEDNY